MTWHKFSLIMLMMLYPDAKSAPDIDFCLSGSDNWFSISGTELKIEPFPIEIKEGEEVSIEWKITLKQKISSGFRVKVKVLEPGGMDICKFPILVSYVCKLINYSTSGGVQFYCPSRTYPAIP